MRFAYFMRGGPMRALRWAAFSRPALPWGNGRIERFFGTLKSALRTDLIRDEKHLVLALMEFGFWYGVARPHQHLGEGVTSGAGHPCGHAGYERRLCRKS